MPSTVIVPVWLKAGIEHTGPTAKIINPKVSDDLPTSYLRCGTYSTEWEILSLNYSLAILVRVIYLTPAGSGRRVLLQHRRIVAQQRPAHNLDRRVALLQEGIVEFLQRILAALHLLVIFA